MLVEPQQLEINDSFPQRNFGYVGICRDQKTIGIKKKPKRISMRVGVKEIFQGVGEWIGGGGNDSGAHVGC